MRARRFLQYVLHVTLAFMVLFSMKAMPCAAGGSNGSDVVTARSASASDPLPRLQVSNNGRFLVTEAGEPFFWLSDTAWKLIQKASLTSRNEQPVAARYSPHAKLRASMSFRRWRPMMGKTSIQGDTPHSRTVLSLGPSSPMVGKTISGTNVTTFSIWPSKTDFTLPCCRCG